MSYEDIRVEPGQVTKVVLARPQARNAMRARTLEELRDAFQSFKSVEGLRAVVVTGDGKDFCAGADIEWMRAGGRLSGEEGKKDARKFAEMLFAVAECPAPVVVAAQGNVFGGGLGLLAACDVALLSDDAKLCFSEVRLGIMPAVISAWVLPKIGVSNARRWYLTAEVFGAAQAVAMGLAHEALPAADLTGKADIIVRHILKNGPEAVKIAKAMIPIIGNSGDINACVDLAVATLVRLRSSTEGQEGLAAFLEKRPPSWVLKP